MIRRLSVLIMSTGLGLALVLAPTATSAEDEPQPNPVEKVVKQVQDLVAPKNVQTAVDATDPPASDDDSPGNETQNPVGPDHASTRGVDVALIETGLLGVNHDSATVNDDDSSSADSTLLSIGGTKVIGTHADSNGRQRGLVQHPRPRVRRLRAAHCAPRLLYSESYASNDGTTSSATARSGILNACLGGSDTDQTNGCDGVVGAGLTPVRRERRARPGAPVRPRPARATSAWAPASWRRPKAAAWVLPPSGPTVKRIPAGWLRPPSAGPTCSASPSTVTPNANPLITEPTDLSLPPGCPDSFSLSCLFLNQGETYLGPGLLAGTAQDALLLTLLKFQFEGALLTARGRRSRPHRDPRPQRRPPDRRRGRSRQR